MGERGLPVTHELERYRAAQSVMSTWSYSIVRQYFAPSLDSAVDGAFETGLVNERLALLVALLAALVPASTEAQEVDPWSRVRVPRATQGQGAIGETFAESQAATLRGVRLIAVAISVSSGTPTGIDESRIRPSIELRLRQAGLTVVELDTLAIERDAADLPGQLVVEIRATGGGGPRQGYSVALRFEQGVRLLRDTTLTAPATTWATTDGGIGDVARARDEILRMLDDQLSRFLNDWLSVNPRR